MRKRTTSIQEDLDPLDRFLDPISRASK